MGEEEGKVGVAAALDCPAAQRQEEGARIVEPTDVEGQAAGGESRTKLERGVGRRLELDRSRQRFLVETAAEQEVDDRLERQRGRDQPGGPRPLCVDEGGVRMLLTL